MNMLAEMVEDQLGLQEWNDVLLHANLDGVYTSSGLYHDSEMLKLVSIISERNNIPADDLVFAFGQFMLPGLVQRYPYLIEPMPDFLSFLESIDDVIHVEVKKLHPGAITPVFNHKRLAPHQLLLNYRSSRKMCQLAEGLISGAAKHFDTQYDLQHNPCLHTGADHCGFLITVNAAAS
ncbi:heme NO-binding domain-containing protein [Congregibacter sp.]|nr:heme NO-binding domain-containing protein [Congregibacter sp.]MDA8962480.1 heme NO-binding domain-containing protein [Congregibacter sp.]